MGIVNNPVDVTTVAPPFTVEQNNVYVPESGTPPDRWARVPSDRPHPLVDLWTQSADPSGINTTKAFVLDKGGNVLVKVNKTNTISWVDVAKELFKSSHVQCRETMQGMLLFGPVDILWVPYNNY